LAGLGTTPQACDGANGAKKPGARNRRISGAFQTACREEGGEKMIWFVVGLAVLVLLGIWLEMLARIVVLHMIGKCHDGYDDN
jgi:hypothetical protein